MMPFRASTILATVALVAAAAAAASLAGSATTAGAAPAPGDPAGYAANGSASYHRIELPGGGGKPFPYTLEVPLDWQVHQPKDTPGIWLGPADAQPPDDPRLVYVRISRVPLTDPAATVAAIKASDAADESWSAPLVEVREVGGVRGVLVQMNSGSGDKVRSTLSLKLPLPKTSVDLMGSAAQSEFAKLRPTFERVLFSARPLVEAPPKPAAHP